MPTDGAVGGEIASPAQLPPSTIIETSETRSVRPSKQVAEASDEWLGRPLQVPEKDEKLGRFQELRDRAFGSLGDPSGVSGSDVASAAGTTTFRLTSLRPLNLHGQVKGVDGGFGTSV